MAFISIIEKNGLFTIELDNNDWTGLYVNGVEVPQNASGGWTYVQSTPGALTFEATANSLQTVNGNDALVLSNGGKDYLCSLYYTEQGKPFGLYGTLSDASNIQNANSQPIYFSQGLMMGSFRAA